MAGNNEDFFSVDEAEAAIYGLTAGEIMKLRLYARATLNLLPADLTEDDLIDEAITRTLEGSRNWNRKLGLVQHLFGVMKSLACDHRRTSTSIVQTAAIELDDAPETELVTPQATETSSIIENQQLIEHFFRIFSNDPNTLHVLEGLLLGESKSETATKRNIRDNEYASARRRITRAALKLNDGGQI